MFRLAGLSENVGFGMKKILLWKELTGKDVEITSAIDYSLVTFTLGKATNVGKEHPKKLPEKTTRKDHRYSQDTVGNNKSNTGMYHRISGDIGECV